MDADRIKTDSEMDELYSTICQGIELLHTQSDIGDGGRARTLFYALANFLEERGIIDHLRAGANYMASCCPLPEPQHRDGESPIN